MFPIEDGSQSEYIEVDELSPAVNVALDSGRPTLVNAVIDPTAGTESGRIGNLNPQRVVAKR